RAAGDGRYSARLRDANNLEPAEPPPQQPAVAPSPLQALPAAPTTTVVRFHITGMTCASCVARVESAIAQVPGVTTVRVNLADESARVEIAAAHAETAEIANAVRQAGYEARPAMRDGEPESAPDRATMRAARVGAIGRSAGLSIVLGGALVVLAMVLPPFRGS